MSAHEAIPARQSRLPRADAAEDRAGQDQAATSPNLLAEIGSTPVEVARAIADRPGQRDEIFALVHASFGNRFADQVVAQLTVLEAPDRAPSAKAPRDAQPEIVDAGAPAQQGAMPIAEAEAYNRAHVASVVDFDRATKGKFARPTGQLDAARVRDWQREHGIHPADGRITRETVAVARAGGQPGAEWEAEPAGPPTVEVLDPPPFSTIKNSRPAGKQHQLEVRLRVRGRPGQRFDTHAAWQPSVSHAGFPTETNLTIGPDGTKEMTYPVSLMLPRFWDDQKLARAVFFAQGRDPNGVETGFGPGAALWLHVDHDAASTSAPDEPRPQRAPSASKQRPPGIEEAPSVAGEPSSGDAPQPSALGPQVQPERDPDGAAWLPEAEKYNLEHLREVVEFDRASRGRFARANGQLDAMMIRDWQAIHAPGEAPGRVTPGTIAAMKASSHPEPVPHPLVSPTGRSEPRVKLLSPRDGDFVLVGEVHAEVLIEGLPEQELRLEGEWAFADGARFLPANKPKVKLDSTGRGRFPLQLALHNGGLFEFWGAAETRLTVRPIHPAIDGGPTFGSPDVVVNLNVVERGIPQPSFSADDAASAARPARAR